MATAERFEELEVWQRARELTKMIYDLSDAGAFTRDFGFQYLHSQPNTRRIREDEAAYHA